MAPKKRNKDNRSHKGRRDQAESKIVPVDQSQDIKGNTFLSNMLNWISDHKLLTGVIAGGTALAVGGGYYLSRDWSPPAAHVIHHSPEEEFARDVNHRIRQTINTTGAEAAEEGKPHVVIVTESHHNPNCTLAEMLALKGCKDKKPVLILEISQQAYDNYKAKWKSIQKNMAEVDAQVETIRQALPRLSGEKAVQARQVIEMYEQGRDKAYGEMIGKMPGMVMVGMKAEEMGIPVVTAVKRHITAEDMPTLTAKFIKDTVLPEVDGDLERAIAEQVKHHKTALVFMGEAHNTIRGNLEKSGMKVTTIAGLDPKDRDSLNRSFITAEGALAAQKVEDGETLTAKEQQALQDEEEAGKAVLARVNALRQAVREGRPGYMDAFPSPQMPEIKTHDDALKLAETITRTRGAER